MCAWPPPVTVAGSVMLLTRLAGSSAIGEVAKRYDVNGRCSRNMYLGNPALTYGTVATTVLPNCGDSAPPLSSHSESPSDAPTTFRVCPAAMTLSGVPVGLDGHLNCWPFAVTAAPGVMPPAAKPWAEYENANPPG